MYKLQEEFNDKMKFKKCASLLSMGTFDVRDEFITNYLPKIKRFTNKMYVMYEEELNGAYDYEDYFCDTVILATELYNSGKFTGNGYDGLHNYTRYLMFQSYQLLRKTYSLRISHIKGIETIKVLKRYRDFMVKEGRIPNISELKEKTNVSERKIMNIFKFENYDDLRISIPSFEEDLVDDLVFKGLKSDLDNALNTLSVEERELVCSLNGYNQEMISQSDYARKKGVPRQTVNQKIGRIYKKIRENNAWLESYR